MLSSAKLKCIENNDVKTKECTDTHAHIGEVIFFNVHRIGCEDMWLVFLRFTKKKKDPSTEKEKEKK